MKYTIELGVPHNTKCIDTVLSTHPRNAEYVYTISNSVKATYTSELLNVCRSGYEESKIDEYIVRLRNTLLFSDLLQQLFKVKSNDLGLFLVKNLPIDEVYGYLKKKTSITEMLLLLSSTILGEPYGFAFRQNEAIIQDIFPRLKDKEHQLNSGNTELLWHTEDAHTDLNPDFIALICLQGDEEAKTFVSCVDPNDIDLNNMKLLSEKHFIIHPDGAFLHNRSQLKSILKHVENSFYVYFDPLYTECLTPEATEALINLNHYINSKAVHICLQQGDLLIIDNRRAVHARSKYSPRFYGSDRWLQRVFIFFKDIPNESLLNSNNRLIIT